MLTTVVLLGINSTYEVAQRAMNQVTETAANNTVIVIDNLADRTIDVVEVVSDSTESIVEAVGEHEVQVVPVFYGIVITLVLLLIQFFIGRLWRDKKTSLMLAGQNPEANVETEKEWSTYLPNICWLTRDVLHGITVR